MKPMRAFLPSDISPSAVAGPSASTWPFFTSSPCLLVYLLALLRYKPYLQRLFVTVCRLCALPCLQRWKRVGKLCKPSFYFPSPQSFVIWIISPESENNLKDNLKNKRIFIHTPWIFIHVLIENPFSFENALSITNHSQMKTILKWESIIN